MCKLFKLFILLFCLPVFLIAQHDNIKFEYLSLEHGLSNNTILDFVQDNQGFLLIATEKDLNKYDGYGFTVYRTIPNDSTSLSDNFCYNLYLDNKGILWIGTKYGLNKYDRKANRFICYFYTLPESEKVNSNTIYAIFNPDSLNNEIF